MKPLTIDNMCLSEDEYNKMVVAGRDLLKEFRDIYQGLVFEEDLSEISNVSRDKICKMLNSDDSHATCLFTGLEWERVLSAAKIYPEDLLEAAHIDYSSPRTLCSRFSIGARDGSPAPDDDGKICAILDLMSDFFMMASAKA